MFFRLSIELCGMYHQIDIHLFKKENQTLPKKREKTGKFMSAVLLQVRHDCEELAGSSSPEDSYDNTLLQSLEIDEKDTRAKVLLQLYIIHFPFLPVHFCILIFYISSQLNMTF